MLSYFSPGETSLLFRLKYRDPSSKPLPPQADRQDYRVMQIATSAAPIPAFLLFLLRHCNKFEFSQDQISAAIQRLAFTARKLRLKGILDRPAGPV